MEKQIQIKSLAEAYRALMQSVSQVDITHLFIVPSSGQGGAEQSALYCIEEILKNHKNNVLVISTDTNHNQWRERFPKRCKYFDFNEFSKTLRKHDKSKTLTRFIIDSKIKHIHLMYSWFGWKTISEAASEICKHSKLYISIFSIPPVTTNLNPGYASDLGPLAPYLSGIFTDNETAAQTIISLFGISQDLIHVLHHPVKAQKRFSKNSIEGGKVLWAGRIDSDKKPELLMRIARNLPDRTFDVYGSNMLSNDEYITEINQVPNINYKGPFVGFDSISTDSYALYLHTAIWEGMPNIILEAMQSGLLVVAPEIGGIGEVVTDERGVLISKQQKAKHYIIAIEDILNNFHLYYKRAVDGQNYVSNNYNKTIFHNQLNNVPHYLGDTSKL